MFSWIDTARRCCRRRRRRSEKEEGEARMNERERGKHQNVCMVLTNEGSQRERERELTSERYNEWKARANESDLIATK